MKAKKWLCVCLALILQLALFGCGTKENTNPPEQSNTSSEDTSMNEKSIPPTINGNSLSQYTIIYRDISTDDRESCRYKDVALLMQNYFRSKYGQILSIAPHTTAKGEKEIILGYVGTRDLGKTYSAEYGYDKYKVVIQGNNIWIDGSFATGVYQGFEALVEKFNSSADGIFSDMEFSGSGKVLKVAAVGDSITHGVNSYNYTQTYPYYIQQMLGFDYYVLNAGLSSMSTCSIDGTFCYANTAEYSKAKALKPDIVLYGLGTNDANPNPDFPNKDWTNPANDRTNVFKNDTKTFWNTFKHINPDVQIIVILPPSLIDKPGAEFWRPVEWTANIEKYVLPLMKELAEEYELPTVDMFTWSKQNPQVFADGLHPLGITYKNYATHIFENISEIIKKP